eukprot:3048717-Prymnesium_polylepis.3
MSTLKKPTEKANEMMATMVKMIPNWRSGCSLAPRRGTTAHNVVSSAAMIDLARASSAALDLK